jgi:hypothetical protein
MFCGFDVTPGPPRDVFLFFASERAFDFCGGTKDERAGGIFLPRVTNAFAPMMARAPISAPSRMIAPMPIRTSSSIVQAWTIAL